MSAAKNKTIMHVIGARPNVMKLGPLYREFAKSKELKQIIVHSGQHYDPPLMAELFEDFDLPMPDHNLAVGSLSPAEQFGEVILRLSHILKSTPIDALITYGDVRSTPAAAIAGHHAKVLTVHYEGGLRAHNRVWSEEFHRITADAYSDIVFTTEPAAHENAVNERRSDDGVYLVGDLMCDSARMVLENQQASAVLKKFGLPQDFVLFTAHHTNNVDTLEGLKRTRDVLKALADKSKLVYPVHPRPKKNFKDAGLWDELEAIDNLMLLPPLRYVDFIVLVNASLALASDSGSIGTECAYLKKPMMYLHHMSERELTLSCGAVRVSDMNPQRVLEGLEDALNQRFVIQDSPHFDGRASERIVDHLSKHL